MILLRLLDQAIGMMQEKISTVKTNALWELLNNLGIDIKVFRNELPTSRGSL